MNHELLAKKKPIAFRGGCYEHQLNQEARNLAERLAPIHGQVVIKREGNKAVFSMVCRSCGMPGSCRLEIHIDRYFRDGADQSAITTGCRRVYRVSDLLPQPPPQPGGPHPESQTSIIGYDLQGRWIPAYPELMIPVTQLSSDYASLKYLESLQLAPAKLYEQFRLMFCERRKNVYEMESHDRCYSFPKLPGTCSVTPAGRFIFNIDVMGRNHGWVAPIPKLETERELSLLFPRRKNWVAVMEREAPGSPWRCRPGWENWKREYECLASRGSSRSNLLGFDAAIEFNRRKKIPAGQRYVVLCHNPLDAARIGPPAVAILMEQLADSDLDFIAYGFDRVIYLPNNSRSEPNGSQSIVAKFKERAPRIQVQVVDLPNEFPAVVDMPEPLALQLVAEALKRRSEKSSRADGPPPTPYRSVLSKSPLPKFVHSDEQRAVVERAAKFIQELQPGANPDHSRGQVQKAVNATVHCFWLCRDDAISICKTFNARCGHPIPKDELARIVETEGCDRGLYADDEWPQPQNSDGRPYLGDFRMPDADELRLIAAAFGVSRIAVAQAAGRGFLLVGERGHCPRFAISDATRHQGILLRLDGQPFPAGRHLPERQTHTLPRSHAKWPVGLMEARTCPRIGIAQSIPDFLALHELIHLAGAWSDVAPVLVLPTPNSNGEKWFSVWGGSGEILFFNSYWIYPCGDPTCRVSQLAVFDYAKLQGIGAAPLTSLASLCEVVRGHPQMMQLLDKVLPPKATPVHSLELLRRQALRREKSGGPQTARVGLEILSSEEVEQRVRHLYVPEPKICTFWDPPPTYDWEGNGKNRQVGLAGVALADD